MPVNIAQSSAKRTITVASCNIASTADVATIVIPSGYAGEICVHDCDAWVTTSLNNCTPDGTLLIRHTPSGGSIATIGTYTAANADDAGDLVGFTADTTYNGTVQLAAGDTITVSTTADTGGGAAGVLTTHVRFRMWKL